MQKILLFAAALFFLSAPASAQEDQSPWYEPYEQISYSELRTLIDNGEVDEARVLNDGWWVTVKTKEGEYFDTKVTPETPIADHLYEAGIPVTIEHYNEGSEEEADDLPAWLSLVINILPLLLFLVFFAGIIFLSRKQTNAYYGRAEKMQADFFERLEKLLTERKEN